MITATEEVQFARRILARDLDSANDGDTSLHDAQSLARALISAQAHIAADLERVCKCIMQLGYATGHADTIDDALAELSAQVVEHRDADRLRAETAENEANAFLTRLHEEKARVTALEKALEPFANEFAKYTVRNLAPGPDIDHWPVIENGLTLGDLRLASTTLKRV